MTDDQYQNRASADSRVHLDKLLSEQETESVRLEHANNLHKCQRSGHVIPDAQEQPLIDALENAKIPDLKRQLQTIITHRWPESEHGLSPLREAISKNPLDFNKVEGALNGLSAALFDRGQSLRTSEPINQVVKELHSIRTEESSPFNDSLLKTLACFIGNEFMNINRTNLLSQQRATRKDQVLSILGEANAAGWFDIVKTSYENSPIPGDIALASFLQPPQEHPPSVSAEDSRLIQGSLLESVIAGEYDETLTAEKLSNIAADFPDRTIAPEVLLQEFIDIESVKALFIQVGDLFVEAQVAELLSQVKGITLIAVPYTEEKLQEILASSEPEPDMVTRSGIELIKELDKLPGVELFPYEPSPGVTKGSTEHLNSTASNLADKLQSFSHPKMVIIASHSIESYFRFYQVNNTSAESIEVSLPVKLNEILSDDDNAICTLEIIGTERGITRADGEQLQRFCDLQLFRFTAGELFGLPAPEDITFPTALRLRGSPLADMQYAKPESTGFMTWGEAYDGVIILEAVSLFDYPLR